MISKFAAEINNWTFVRNSELFPCCDLRSKSIEANELQIEKSCSTCQRDILLQ